MNKEELIKKWLDHNLNAEEQHAFEQLEDYEELIKLNTAVQQFKAPEFSIDKGFADLQRGLTDQSKGYKVWMKPLLQIAAILVIGLSLFYYISGLDTNIQTSLAEQQLITLPDASTVTLNANSELRYNKRQWSDSREIHLSGEAYFRVAKGATFEVKTVHGTVEVLGTQFNVKERKSYFEVTCFEGVVAVTHNNETRKLHKGDSFLMVDNEHLISGKNLRTQPFWLDGESSFNGIPLHHVLNELQNHYNISIEAQAVDTSRRFTGSFTHKDLNLALQSILIPLNIEYTVSENTVILKGE
jgi:transmembrane sensor